MCSFSGEVPAVLPEQRPPGRAPLRELGRVPRFAPILSAAPGVADRRRRHPGATAPSTLSSASLDRRSSRYLHTLRAGATDRYTGRIVNGFIWPQVRLVEETRERGELSRHYCVRGVTTDRPGTKV